MFLSIRLFGIEWLTVELEREPAVVELVDEACIACEDSGDPCAVCGVELVDE